MAKPKVLVALSGGVDSSVAAILLKEQGCELIGITFNVYDPVDYRFFPLQQGINDASILARKLNIPYYIIDVQQQFRDVVIHDFIENYIHGKTPNPCSLCNFKIKWSKLIEIADNLGCEYVATGHYVVLNRFDNRHYLSIPQDNAKDQSCFLWRLTQNQLSRTIFPLGSYKKDEVKQLAAERGLLQIAKKRESYNICFIPDGDYRTFIKSNMDAEELDRYNGHFVSGNGEILGEYSGIWNYTVGQKKGIPSGLGNTKFVVQINARQNEISLGNKEDLFKNTVVLDPFNLMKYECLPVDLEFKAKYNYKSNFETCTIHVDQNGLVLKFVKPVPFLSPGQSIAIYQEEDLLGGGVVVTSFNS